MFPDNMRLNAERKRYLVGVVATLALLWLILSKLNRASDDFEEVEVIDSIPFETNVIPSVRQCLRDGFYSTGTTEDYLDKYDDCLDLLPFQELDRYHMGRFNENKVFLPLSPSFDESDCIWLTVGVGGDDQVEREFKARHPLCKLYGIEASPDQYAGFGDVGTIIPYGVGVEGGVFKLTVREGLSYYDKNVTIMPFSELLDKFVGKRIVHYMTIDIEGFEYSILNEILTGRRLANEGIVFCQIDAELHETRPDSNEPLQHYLHQFNMDKSNYLPIFRSLFLGKHNKITFINTDHHECQRAFNIAPYMV